MNVKALKERMCRRRKQIVGLGIYRSYSDCKLAAS